MFPADIHLQSLNLINLHLQHMPDLIAQGLQISERWRKPLAEEEHFLLGRSTGVWSAGWDAHISRRHAEVVWSRGNLWVTMLSSAGNPIYYRGQRMDQFSIKPGEHFVIGSTTFSLVEEQAKISLQVPRPVTEKTFARQELRQVSFRDPDRRIAALARLPDVIATSATTDELHSRLMNVLLSGIPLANSVALVRCTEEQRVEVLHWDQRALNQQEFSTSAKLVRQAIESQQSVVHIWNGYQDSTSQLTASVGVDWAFCLPLSGRSGTLQALYVTGNFSDLDVTRDAEALRDDLKFAELAATTFSRLRDAQAAERRLAGLAQFLSPVVLSAIAERDIEDALQPREAELTVIFCDLRGFTRHAEQSAHNLFALLEHVSAALSVMTRHILAHGGVIGDFHGDAVMGFWGWPFPQRDAPQRAARAALEIQVEFARAKLASDAQLAQFQIGIGIATGRGVAGKIGSHDQVKVTAFGPVVNLASRLESLTKAFHTSILLDGITAETLTSSPEVVLSQRKIAPVLPWGFSTPVEVSELLVDSSPTAYPAEYLADYQHMVAALQRGEWLACRTFLEHSPVPDPAREFIRQYVAARDYVCPAHWPGAIELREK
jgi:adenylate cyclase